MACECSKYAAMIKSTKSAISKARIDLFSSKLALRSLEEKAIRTAHPLESELNNCCQLERDKLIDLEVDLYLAICKLEAYKAKLSGRDIAIIAARRNASLEAYRLKYEAEMVEKGEVRHFELIDETAEGFDEMD